MMQHKPKIKALKMCDFISSFFEAFHNMSFHFEFSSSNMKTLFNNTFSLLVKRSHMWKSCFIKKICKQHKKYVFLVVFMYFSLFFVAPSRDGLWAGGSWNSIAGRSREIVNIFLWYLFPSLFEKKVLYGI